MKSLVHIGLGSLLIGYSPIRIVWRDCNAPAIGVSVTLVRSNLADEIETVAGERRGQFSGSERLQATIVDGHATLDDDRDPGLLLGKVVDLYAVLRAFR